ncbi:MAG: hypothetical protein IPJ81_06535 [Chitinophagaceae bacterium]|nr:hypothetical protein [Chitinophagaceae bacterium]
MKNKITLLEIEANAANSLLTEEEYSLALWIFLLNKENKKNVLSLAKNLNIYPKPANVHYSIMKELTIHISNNN